MTEDPPFEPRPGMVVRHYKNGHLYTVLYLATLEATLEPAVVYQSSATGRVWVRTLANFTELVSMPGSDVSTPCCRFFPET